ncbi:MAG: cation transporter [Prevotella sp.]|nr:cation transporter [Prevotella sp.]
MKQEPTLTQEWDKVFPQGGLTKKNRSAQIIRTSIVGIAANILLAAFKAVVGILASSVAIVMDAVNNLSDALSSVITIIGTKLSQRPADREHPFGFGRIEYFSAIIIAVIVLSAGITSLIESVKKVFDPTEPEYTTVTLVVIVVAIVVKLVLGRYVKKKGEQLSSDALIASGSDALFDAFITLSTLVSAGIMLLWHVSLDGILGALISLIIIKAGIEMLASPVNELLGSRISPKLLKEIKGEVLDFEGVHGVFDIILHNYGPDVLIGSLHVNVYDTMNAHEIHGLTRSISEQMFERHGIIMTVGIYAVATGANKRADLQNAVMQTLAKHQDVTQVHGFYYFEPDNRVSVDVVPDISVHDEHTFRHQLEEELKTVLPDMNITIVIDHNYSNEVI